MYGFASITRSVFSSARSPRVRVSRRWRGAPGRSASAKWTRGSHYDGRSTRPVSRPSRQRARRLRGKSPHGAIYGGQVADSRPVGRFLARDYRPLPAAVRRSAGASRSAMRKDERRSTALCRSSGRVDRTTMVDLRVHLSAHDRVDEQSCTFRLHGLSLSGQVAHVRSAEAVCATNPPASPVLAL